MKQTARPMRLADPLTEEEREFITAHLALVSRFLAVYQLPYSEWYDVIVFRYMLSCRKWLARPELHQWQFSTIAFRDMHSAVNAEHRKTKRHIQTISLETPVGEHHGEIVTLADVLTPQNCIQKF